MKENIKRQMNYFPKLLITTITLYNQKNILLGMQIKFIVLMLGNMDINYTSKYLEIQLRHRKRKSKLLEFLLGILKLNYLGMSTIDEICY